MTAPALSLFLSRSRRFAAWLALAAAGPAAAQQSRSFDRELRGRLDTTFAFDRRGSVSVSATSGEIIVTGWARDEIRIHATSERGSIRLNASPSRVGLELASMFRGHGDTKFEVSVPQGVRVLVRTQAGDISIRGTKGEVEAHTQSGDVHVDDVANRLDVSTFSGDVRARGIAGDVEIGTISGDVELNDVRGTIEAKTTSGGVVMRGVTSKLVRARTTSGDVAFGGAIDPAGRYELVAHSGDIQMSLPADASAQLTLSTWSGEIDSDFQLTLKPGEQGIGSATAKRFTFDIGGGAGRITAETFSGDITIRRGTR
jgi:DUF4097 and DUF4098 domain-containing protein YvlB